ncbi:MAG: pantothenate kinase [Phormidesmis sp. RL_2_1]|nr:pantothenate kinase [Phormidesmis sp. RL_2_1]
MSQAWLSLVMGNTRLHWGLFSHHQLIESWHTPHFTADRVEHLLLGRFELNAWQDIWPETTCKTALWPVEKLSADALAHVSALWIASAVPEQMALWEAQTAQGGCVELHVVRRSHIPLAGLYPALGLDRAINLLGAGDTRGWPVIVMDAGTALTFTAGAQQCLWGGAILPGIRLQKQALAQGTAALAKSIATDLPLFSDAAAVSLPKRWATNTPDAIASGLAYGALSAMTDYLQDWWQHFPTGKAVLTGGDGPILHSFLQKRTPEIATRVQLDSRLMFWGMRRYRQRCLSRVDSGKRTESGNDK